MSALLESMLRFFQSEDWSYLQLQDESVLSLAYRGRNGTWTCVAQAIDDDQSIFLFYSSTPIDMSSGSAALAELVARANYGLLIGNFELNPEDGHIRFKTSLDLTGLSPDVFHPGGLVEGLIRQSVHANVSTMDEYLPAILAVAEQRQTPAEAIATIET
jgi:hypothetical protein